jgi:calcium-dependent protein kinase
MATDSIVSKLNPEQIQELTTAFQAFDGNKNGFITSEEMKECLRRSKIPHQNAEVQRVISAMDYNKDGKVSFAEYMKFMAMAYNGEVSPLPF